MALFIFGAGATRGASFVNPSRHVCIPPLDKDFFTQLQRIANPKYRNLIDDVLSDVVDVFGYNFNITMETVFTTYEHTLRMIKATGESKQYKTSDYQKKHDRLCQAIAAVFEESLNTKKGKRATLKHRICDHHSKFVKQVLRKKDSIISFNYDCLIDTTLRQRGNFKWNSQYGYGFDSHNVVNYAYWQPKHPAIKGNTVHLYKLHGSLHFQVDDPDKTDSKIRFKQRPYTKQFGDMQFTIIPPESNKDYDKGVFGLLWTKAREEINNSEQIVLIGYSLPSTDLHSSTLFRTGVNLGKLKSLVIVNPDREARQRIRYVFQRGLMKSTRVLSFNYFSEFLAGDRSLWDF
jgi:hypothetical protein